MDNVMDVMSKFKNGLDSIICDYKDKISEIEKEEDFIMTLGDVVNYSKSDCLLLPFYDETILSRVFERVFPLSNSEFNKIKTAKYLIESSKSIDKSHFPQYNDSVKDVSDINKRLSKFYDKLLSDDKLKSDKEEFSLKIERYSTIYDKILDDSFSSLIDDVPLFHEVIDSCDLSLDEVNVILNVAIKSNLGYLDNSGVIVSDDVDIIDMKEQNNIFMDEINDLSNLLGDEQEVFMELKNELVLLLSNIIQDRLKLLADTKNDMKRTEDYKKIENLFNNIDSIVDVSDDDLRSVLSDITDSDTVDGIISNVDMIKIVLNGKNSGLDLSLDESQEDLIKGVYEIVNNYRTELESKNKETREYLEDFISKCQGLSSEIGTGVVRDVDTLDSIFSDNNVPISDVVKCKYEILSNNSKNYNLNLEGKVKEEIDLRIVFQKYSYDFDSYSDIEKKVLVDNCSKDCAEQVLGFISDNDISLDGSQLFIILLLSNKENFSNIYEVSKEYDFDFSSLFMIPGVFVSVDFSSILDGYRDDEDFYVIESLGFIKPMYDLFLDNISILEANNRSVSDCFKNNILSLIVPDLSKNITILNDISLSNKEFSIVCINPFLATSRSSFAECGLGDYIKNNPLRLTTSYYRLKSIASNIVSSRRDGKPIFRSLNDKKTYWLNKNITR